MMVCCVVLPGCGRQGQDDTSGSTPRVLKNEEATYLPRCKHPKTFSLHTGYGCKHSVLYDVKKRIMRSIVFDLWRSHTRRQRVLVEKFTRKYQLSRWFSLWIINLREAAARAVDARGQHWLDSQLGFGMDANLSWAGDADPSTGYASLHSSYIHIQSEGSLSLWNLLSSAQHPVRSTTTDWLPWR